MKDYKLSEIKAICEAKLFKYSGIDYHRCSECSILNICPFQNKIACPSDWQIDEEEQDDDGE